MIIRLTTAIALVLAAASGYAQDYPTRMITLTNPNPPGGMNQILAQPLSVMLQKLTGQPAPIINRPGGTAGVGTAYVANQPPDGYNLLVTTPNLYLVIEKDGEVTRAARWIVTHCADASIRGGTSTGESVSHCAPRTAG